MRAYHLIRYVPDPHRGETLNVAIAAFDGDDARVLALPAEEIASRTACLAPHVDPSLAQSFVAELSRRASDSVALRQLLEGFNPHVLIEEPRRISAAADLEIALSNAYATLVGQPARRKPHGQSKWTLDRALHSLEGTIPSFVRHARRKVSVAQNPEMFGLERELFEGGEPPSLGAFDTVLPNCVRVVALQGLIVREKTPVSQLFEARKTLHEAGAFFEGHTTSKTVITGALLLPHGRAPASPSTRDGMREALEDVSRKVDIDGLESRPAVFDLSLPADARYLERLSALLTAAEG